MKRYLASGLLGALLATLWWWRDIAGCDMLEPHCGFYHERDHLSSRHWYWHHGEQEVDRWKKRALNAEAQVLISRAGSEVNAVIDAAWDVNDTWHGANQDNKNIAWRNLNIALATLSDALEANVKG